MLSTKSRDLLEAFPGDAGRDERIVQLAVDGPVITDLRQAVHSHHHHEPEPWFHRLQKVMPIITAMNEKFEANYNPHLQNSIDEAMIPFKGTCIYTYTVYIFGRCLVHVYSAPRHKCPKF